MEKFKNKKIYTWIDENNISNKLMLIEDVVDLLKEQIADLLKTSKIEVGLQKYLEDSQVYNNYRRNFILPDDSEIVASYVGIYIRKLLVDIKSKLSK